MHPFFGCMINVSMRIFIGKRIFHISLDFYAYIFSIFFLSLSFSFFSRQKGWSVYHRWNGDKLVRRRDGYGAEGRRSEGPFRLICGHTSWRRNPRFGTTQRNLLLVTSWPRNSVLETVPQRDIAFSRLLSLSLSIDFIEYRRILRVEGPSLSKPL